MQFLDEKGRAVVHALLRSPETIGAICDEAKGSPGALAELEALVWLFAGAIMTLEHALAFHRRGGSADDELVSFEHPGPDPWPHVQHELATHG